MRDIRGWITIAEKGLELRLLGFGEHLAVALLVEAIDHDAIVSRQILEDARALVAEGLQRRGAEHRLQRGLHPVGEIDGRPRAFELDDEGAVRRMMKQGVEGRRGDSDMAAHRSRNRIDLVAHVRARARPEVAAELAKVQTMRLFAQTQEFRGVGAGLDHDAIGFANAKQRAVRLDRGGEMNLLALAIRKIRGSKGRRRDLTCWQRLCLPWRGSRNAPRVLG